MLRIEEILQTLEDIFTDEFDEGEITCEADVADFWEEEADYYIEKLSNQEKLELLIEATNGRYPLKDFFTQKAENLQEAVDISVRELICHKLSDRVKTAWYELTA